MAVVAVYLLSQLVLRSLHGEFNSAREQCSASDYRSQYYAAITPPFLWLICLVTVPVYSDSGIVASARTSIASYYGSDLICRLLLAAP